MMTDVKAEVETQAKAAKKAVRAWGMSNPIGMLVAGFAAGQLLAFLFHI